MDKTSTIAGPEEGEAPAQESAAAPDLGKFKSVEALLHAYGELESEFTRRSQRLKALEQQAAERSAETAQTPPGREELFRAVTSDDELCARVAGEFFAKRRGVPLMGGSGSAVVVPVKRPSSIAEAGALALGYLKKQG